MKYRALLRRLKRQLPPVPPSVIRVRWITSADKVGKPDPKAADPDKSPFGECQPEK